MVVCFQVTCFTKPFLRLFRIIKDRFLQCGIWSRNSQIPIWSTMCKWTRPFCGTDCPEVTQKPFLGPGSLSFQCRHWESLKVLAGLAFCEMLSQYAQSAFQGLSGVGGQQQFATQTLRVHLVGIDLSFAVDFFSCFFPRQGPQKIHRKIPHKIHTAISSENSPRISAEAFSGRITRKFKINFRG